MGSRVKGNSSVSCLNYSGKRYNDLLELAVIRLETRMTRERILE